EYRADAPRRMRELFAHIPAGEQIPAIERRLIEPDAGDECQLLRQLQTILGKERVLSGDGSRAWPVARGVHDEPSRLRIVSVDVRLGHRRGSRIARADE